MRGTYRAVEVLLSFSYGRKAFTPVTLHKAFTAVTLKTPRRISGILIPSYIPLNVIASSCKSQRWSTGLYERGRLEYWRFLTAVVRRLFLIRGIKSGLEESDEAIRDSLYLSRSTFKDNKRCKTKIWPAGKLVGFFPPFPSFLGAISGQLEALSGPVLTFDGTQGSADLPPGTALLISSAFRCK